MKMYRDLQQRDQGILARGVLQTFLAMLCIFPSQQPTAHLLHATKEKKNVTSCLLFKTHISHLMVGKISK
jgi:hypothetical protein